ncbi:MAG: hypothetical protein ACYSUY_03835 [Planctomycetota bacterium]|jgi:hypothetical protein
MKPENIEEILNKLGTEDVPADARQIAQEISKDFSETLKQPKRYIFLEYIMKSPIKKLAAAAAIIIGVLVSINLWDKSIPTAYALGQTIQASHSVSYLHIKNFFASHDEPMESWVEFDPSGQLKNMRFNKPAWMDPSDGATVIVWKDNKMQLWIKKKNFLVTLKDKEVADQVLKAIEQLDPKLAVERLQSEEKQGKLEIEIEVPANKAEPIIVTATSIEENDSPLQRIVLFVDQATKLVNSTKFYNLKDGEYHLEVTVEYYDYNQTIDEKMFTFDNLPDDVMRIDQTAQEVGLAQGDLSDEEIAIEVVRQFLESLIAQDYAKAGRLFSGTPAERMQKTYGQIRFIQIMSIGEPTKHFTRGLKVPCKIQIEKDGQITIWEPEHSYVRQVHGQPGRWEIIGGFLGI